MFLQTGTSFSTTQGTMGFWAILLATLAFMSCAPQDDFWWQEPKGPAYQVLVYSFADSNGDGIGDLKGLTEKLDYFKGLNVQALWLSPINPAASYHGYDVTNYKDIDPRLGTMDDFEVLLEEARTREIRIIMDLVFNHSSKEHPWFKSFAQDPQGPYKDYYVQRVPGTAYGSGGMGKFYKLPDGREYFAAFWDGMPDLNSANPAVQREFRNILDFWIKQGVSGFRFDAVKHSFDANELAQGSPSHRLNKELWTDLVTHAQKRKPDIFTIGEVLTDSPLEMSGWSGVFSSLFDFPLAEALINEGPLPVGADLLGNLGTNLKLYGKNAPYYPSNLLSNHDQDRIVSVIKERLGADPAGIERWTRSLAAIIHTLPGLPWIYYGEELGMEGRRWANDDVNRRLAMPWADQYRTTWQIATGKTEAGINQGLASVEDQMDSPTSLYAWYQELSGLRLRFPELSNGLFRGPETLINQAPDGILAWSVEGGTRTLGVVHNMTGLPYIPTFIQGPRAPLWSSLGSDAASLSQEALAPGESRIY